jgi:predicted nucleic acid-binding protein
MLLDANLLLYAVDRASPYHTAAASWLAEQFNGPRRVGLPWQSLVAFVRISTHPRASANPLSPQDAQSGPRRNAAELPWPWSGAGFGAEHA